MTCPKGVLGLLVVLLLGWNQPELQAAVPAPEAAGEQTAAVTADSELDAYYTSVSLNFPLTREQVPDLGEMSEFGIYRHLLLRSFVPRFLTLEASTYPMPLLGVYLRRHQAETYQKGEIGSSVNLIESVTAGFREPYAVSLFFGNLVDFIGKGETRKGGNRGYIGYLFSVGDRHIKKNMLVDDRWFEFEWKLKGDRNFEDERLSWSFRLGSKFHENPEISDVFYVGLRRSNLDYNSEFLSWLKNSSVNLMTEFSTRDSRFLRQEIVFGKTYPLKHVGLALSLDFGGIWETHRIYSGSLADEELDNFVLVFRPNMAF